MITNLHQVDDSKEFLRGIPDNTYTACITDPPYGISFMGKAWDTFAAENVKDSGFERQKENHSTGRKDAYEAGRYNRATSDNRQFQSWCEAWAREVLRTLKPGGMLLSFCGSRTFHRMVSGIEDAGFEIRDCMFYMYGSGFPKSHNIANSIDKKMGCDNRGHAISSGNKYHSTTGKARPNGEQLEKYKARTEAGEPWTGYGTALKPAYEPIIVAMKPLDGSFAENALTHGVAGLNIDAGRIATEDSLSFGSRQIGDGIKYNPIAPERMTEGKQNDQGRWPSNIILDPYTAGLLDGQAGEQVSRFFYCAKASKEEREAGLHDFDAQQVNDGRKTSIDNAYQRGDTLRRNIHPTVKPLDIMRYLVKLVKMPADNHILDLFMGSGSTGCACALEGIEEFTGLDKTAEYIPIAKARIEHWKKVAERGADYEQREYEKQQELFKC